MYTLLLALLKKQMNGIGYINAERNGKVFQSFSLENFHEVTKNLMLQAKTRSEQNRLLDCGRRRGRDVLREQHRNMYII